MKLLTQLLSLALLSASRINFRDWDRRTAPLVTATRAEKRAGESGPYQLSGMKPPPAPSLKKNTTAAQAAIEFRETRHIRSVNTLI